MEFPYYTLHLDPGAQGSAGIAAPSDVPTDGSKPFTVTAWVFFTDDVGFKTIVSRGDGMIFGIQGKKLALYIKGFQKAVSANDIVRNEWHYVAAAYDGEMIRLFVDGEMQSSMTAGGKAQGGKADFSFGRNFHGCLRNVVLYKESLSRDRISDHYLDTDGAAAVYDFTMNPPKETVSGQEISLNGGARIVKSTTAALFRNQGFLEVDTYADVNPASVVGEPYTVQAWIRFEPAEGADYYTILTNTDYNNTAGMTLWMEEREDGYHLGFSHGYFSLEANEVISKSVIPVKKWTNVAVTFADATARMYIDGALDTEKGGILPMAENLSEHTCYIGADVDGASGNGLAQFSGAILRVDIWKKELAASEIIKYMDQEPEIYEEGISAAFFFCDNFLNRCDLTLAGRKRGVELGLVEQQEARAVCVERNAVFAMPEETNIYEGIVIPGELRAQTLKSFQMSYCGVREREELSEEVEENEFFLVNHFRMDGRIYFVRHTPEGSDIVAHLEEDDDTGDVVVWVIELLLIIIGGVGDIVFGLPLVRSNKLMNLLRRLTGLAGPVITAFANKTSKVSNVVRAIVDVIYGIYKQNMLKEILKCAFQLGWWALARAVLKLVARCFSLPVYYAAGLTTLAISIIAHVADYPDTEKGMPRLCVKEISFSGFSQSVGAIEISAANGPIHRRKPEWTSNASYPVAYSIEGLKNGKNKYSIRVQAKFATRNDQKADMQIRAKDVSEDKVFGDSDVITIQMAGKGNSLASYYLLSFPNHTLTENRIARKTLKLQWQCSADSGNTWTDMVKSEHVIYVMLRSPQPPWEKENIWRSALEASYGWVEGCVSQEAVMQNVTQKVNSGIKLKYEVQRGAPRYIDGYGRYHLQQAIADINDQTRAEAIVNCIDCAFLVIMFSNLWGCGLQQKRMANGHYDDIFLCNEILAIGFANKKENWKAPFQRGGFGFHAVAVQGDGQDHRNCQIYDACLQVNAGKTPWSSSKTPQLSTGMPFSTIIGYPPPSLKEVDPTSYREHLARNAKGGIDVCRLFPNNYAIDYV